MSEGKGMSGGGSVLLLTVLGSVGQLMGFCYRVALSRMVGAEVMGLYQLIMPVYSVLMSLTGVGLTGAVSNLTSQHLAHHNPLGAAQMLRSCIRWFFLLLLPLTVVLLCWSDPISVGLLGDARTQLGLILLLPCLAFTGLENLHKHAFYGAGQANIPAVVELLEQGVRACAVLGLLACFLPQYPERVVGLIVLGMVLCEIFSSLVLTALYHRRFHPLSCGGVGQRPGVRTRQIAAIAIPVGVTALLGNWMGAVNATLIPRKLVEGGMERGEAMSEFGVVCGMTLPMLSLPTVFLGAMSLVMTPKLVRARALGERDQIRQMIAQAMGTVSGLALPSMGILVVLGEDLGQFLFQQQGMGRYLLPLALVMAMSCYQSTLGSVLNGIGDQASVALISILCDLVQLGFTASLVCIPEIGIGGYVLGSLAATLLGLGLCLWVTMRRTGWKLQLFPWVTAPVLAALLMALCCNLLFRWLKRMGCPLGVSSSLTTLFGLILYGITLQVQGISLKGLFQVGRSSEAEAE